MCFLQVQIRPMSQSILQYFFLVSRFLLLSLSVYYEGKMRNYNSIAYPYKRRSNKYAIMDEKQYLQDQLQSCLLQRHKTVYCIVTIQIETQHYQLISDKLSLLLGESYLIGSPSFIQYKTNDKQIKNVQPSFQPTIIQLIFALCCPLSSLMMPPMGIFQ